MCAGRTTLGGDSECCIDCREICCRGGEPPSLPCFDICAHGCPDYATCGDCINANNTIGKEKAQARMEKN
ncbi:hypothetical protein ACET3Z_000594 [Daucus carota]